MAAAEAMAARAATMKALVSCMLGDDLRLGLQKVLRIGVLSSAGVLTGGCDVMKRVMGRLEGGRL